jgi:hypothetical protein
MLVILFPSCQPVFPVTIVYSCSRLHFCDGLSNHHKNPSIHNFPQIIQFWQFTNAMLDSCLAFWPQLILLPHYRYSRRFKGLRCHSAYQNDLLDLASDEIALSESQRLPTLCQSPTDIFDPVPGQSQIISQIMVDLCDQSMFTTKIAIILIREASLFYCVAKIHRPRLSKSIDVQYSRLPLSLLFFIGFKFR